MDWKTKRFWIVVILLLATGIYVNILRYSRVFGPESVDLIEIPLNIRNWQIGETIFLNQKTKDVLRSDQDVWRTYVNSSGQTVVLFVSYFKDQKYGAQIHSPKHCLPGGGWKIMDKEIYQIEIHNSPLYKLKVNKLIVSNNGYNELILYWFWTRSGIITSEYHLKLNLAKNALLSKPTDAAFVRINLPIIENNIAKTLQLASEFTEEIFPNIKQVLSFKK